MREIKFRVWDNQFKYLAYYDWYDLLTTEFHVNMDERPWMQYTGLKDKNGKEIYEGDIVAWTYANFPGVSTSELVRFGVAEGENNGKWLAWVVGECVSLYDVYDQVVVLGNIYENPELVESK